MYGLAYHFELGERCKSLQCLCARSTNSRGTTSSTLGSSCGDAVEQVLDCPLRVVEGGIECGYTLFSRESHRHELIDLCFILLILGWLRRLLLLLFLLLLLLLFRRLHLLFNFRLRLRFLSERRGTATWVITTRKSVSFRANFSIFSSLVVVLPLKIIFWVSTGCPFSSRIFSLSSAIWMSEGILSGRDLSQQRRLRP